MSDDIIKRDYNESPVTKWTLDDNVGLIVTVTAETPDALIGLNIEAAPDHGAFLSNNEARALGEALIEAANQRELR